MADWFAAKRYGFGAGLPIAWQGWLVMSLFLLVIFGAALLFRDRPLIIFSIAIPATGLFMLVAARTTRGGWRWRWGKRD